MIGDEMEQGPMDGESPFVAGAFEATDVGRAISSESEAEGYSPYPAGEAMESEMSPPERFYRAFMAAWQAMGGSDNASPGSMPALPSAPALPSVPVVPIMPSPGSAPSGGLPELGSLAAKYESREKPGVVSSGVGDPGGVSYGLYQMTSKQNGVIGGTVKVFVEQSPYAALFAGHTPGSPSFTAVWKGIAERDPVGFGKAQWRFTKAKFYDALAKKLRKDKGFDPDRRSNALQQVMWATAVGHGVGGASKLIGAALAGRDPNGLDDAQIIVAIYAERLRMGDNGKLAYYPSVGPQWTQGLIKNFRKQGEDALEMLRRERGAQRELYEGPSAFNAGELGRPPGFAIDGEMEEESPFLAGEAFEGGLVGEMEAEHNRNCRCCFKAAVEKEVEERLAEQFSWPSWPSSWSSFSWPWSTPQAAPAPQSPDVVALEQAIASGVTSPVQLTDVVFYARHPERGGRPIDRSETAAIEEWKSIQRDVVMPRLAGATAPAAPPVTTAPSSAPSYTPPSSGARFPPMVLNIKVPVRHQPQVERDGCFRTSVAMAKSAGVRGVKGYSRSTVYQIALKEDSRGRVTEWDDRRGAEGVAYMDQQLERGRPVVVGLSYKDDSYNGDKITDHFVLVTSRYTDAEGRRYYGFNDPAYRAPDGADTNPENRFLLDPVTKRLSRPQKPGTTSTKFSYAPWDVSMIRINEE